MNSIIKWETQQFMTYCSFSKKLLSFWVFSILLVNITQAQTLDQMEITLLSAPDQSVAVFMDYPDKAAIIIESPITTLRFSSNMNGIVQEMHEAERGRYVLILEPFTQIIVIDSPGYIQQRQRIGSPQPRDVHYFEVKPVERTSDLISVVFNVEPSDARLFVNGQETPVNQTTQLAPRSVEVRLEREGYRTVTEAVEVSDQNIQYNYILEQVQQQLVSINTQPTNAEIRVDNVREGTSDGQGVFEMFRFPGSYQLQVSADGYLPVQTVIEVTENEPNEFTYTLERNFGTLRIELSPADANVVVNKRERVLTDGVIELPPGLHSLEVTRPFHNSYIETIRIERGETETRRIFLTPHTGSMQLVVSPSNAQIKLINSAGIEVDSWTGSQGRTNLLIGGYHLEISAPRYETKSKELKISQNEITNLRVELPQIRQSDQGTFKTDRETVGRRLSILYSGELLRLPSDSFKKYYGSPYMSGLSFGVLLHDDLWHLRFTIGGLFTSPSKDNIIATSGALSYFYSQPAIGIRRGIWQTEAIVTLGSFRFPILDSENRRKQSFIYAGIGSGISLPIGLDTMVTYALYTEPQQKMLMGVRLSWRIEE